LIYTESDGRAGSPTESFTLVPLERIHRPSAEDFHRDYVNPGRPVVLTGLLDDWPARERWSVEYLTATLGSTRVLVAVSERDAFQPDPEHGFDETFHEEMTFAEYVGHLTNPTPNRRYYLNQQHFVKTFPDIASDVHVPDYIDRRKLHSVFFWFGSQGIKSPLHYDWKHNLLAQVHGAKKLVLYDPKHLARLYPYSRRTAIPHLSEVDVDNPDLKRFPRFADAEPVEDVLEAGEMLFLPSLWWHRISAVDLNIAVNFWWDPPLRTALRWPRLRVLTWSDLRQSVRRRLLTPADRQDSVQTAVATEA
jgi:hypothetical protein